MANELASSLVASPEELRTTLIPVELDARLEHLNETRNTATLQMALENIALSTS